MKKISKKTAILATKLGYRDKSNDWTFYCKEFKCYFSTNSRGGLSGEEETFKQCTQAELQAWLRKKGVEAWVNPIFSKGIMYQANAHKSDGVGIYLSSYDKYEKAMEVSLYQGLKLLMIKFSK